MQTSTLRPGTGRQFNPFFLSRWTPAKPDNRKAPPSGTSRPGLKRILVADDDASVRGSLTAVLESEGYAVDEARDGNEVVARATENAPDLVLLDLNMQDTDGRAAFSHLDRVSPRPPVIAITARPHQYSEAVKLGVAAFMEKPLNIAVLMRAIQRFTSETEPLRSSRLAHPEFVTQLLGGTGV
jgi:two-component system response regulator GlrR